MECSLQDTLEASLARGEQLLPGDLIAFLCGPLIPPPVRNDRHVWLFAPSFVNVEAAAAFIDMSFETRLPTPRYALTSIFSQTPYTHDTSKCRTGPLCEVLHGPDTRCVCDHP